MTRVCVIGWPIKHSRSPLIHGYWLKRYGIAGSYERVPVEPGKASEFIRTLAHNGFAGCNVTVPHKEAAFTAVAAPDETARRLGVVNTVYFSDGVLCGTSSDGDGFLASLAAEIPDWNAAGKTVMLLGAGGAAQAIAGALIAAGVDTIRVANRSPARAQALRARFGPRIEPVAMPETSEDWREVDLLVNTTPLGMTGQPPLAVGLAGLPGEAVVADIVYTPLETDLLAQAKRRGHRTVPGLGMLLHQAVTGFTLWFGHRPEVTAELYERVAADIRNPPP